PRQQREWRQGQEGHARTPIQGLLRRREELKLSAEQVSRLEALEQRFRTQNQPLMERLRAARPQPPRDGAARREMTEEQRRALRESMRARREELRPTMEQLRQNHQAARREVESILNDTQKQQIRQWAEQRQGRRGEHGMRRGEHRRRDGEQRRERRPRPPQAPTPES
ncbi:MAG TPA: hypothetical protein VFR81_17865, partial [Longimicrobium sp.]|nr:hypothetical protein [Longimicrobium sp.]